MDNASDTLKDGWNWKTRKPNNILVVHGGPTTGFFKSWCIYMRPIVKLSDKEIDIVACFLKQRWELSKVISDPIILDSQLMSNEVKDRVISECGITRQHFYVLMSSLKKHKVFTSAGINPRLVPNIRKNDDGIFQFLILFKDDVAKDDV